LFSNLIERGRGHDEQQCDDLHPTQQCLAAANLAAEVV